MKTYYLNFKVIQIKIKHFEFLKEIKLRVLDVRVWHGRELHVRVRVHAPHHRHHLLVQLPLCLPARLLTRHHGLQRRYASILVPHLTQKDFLINKGRWCRSRRNRVGPTSQTEQTALLLWNRLKKKVSNLNNIKNELNFKRRTYRFNDLVDPNPRQAGRSRRIVILGLKLRHFLFHLTVDEGDHIPHNTIINLAGLLVGIRRLY